MCYPTFKWVTLNAAPYSTSHYEKKMSQERVSNSQLLQTETCSNIQTLRYIFVCEVE
jgi:hypothetical protein